MPNIDIILSISARFVKNTIKANEKGKRLLKENTYRSYNAFSISPVTGPFTVRKLSTLSLANSALGTANRDSLSSSSVTRIANTLRSKMCLEIPEEDRRMVVPEDKEQYSRLSPYADKKIITLPEIVELFPDETFSSLSEGDVAKFRALMKLHCGVNYPYPNENCENSDTYTVNNKEEAVRIINNIAMLPEYIKDPLVDYMTTGICVGGYEGLKKTISNIR